MFGFRTPSKGSKPSQEPPRRISTGTPPAVPVSERPTSSVRRSIGEWESGRADPLTPTSPKKVVPVEPPKPKKVLSQGSKVAVKVSVEASRSPPTQPKYTSRLAEAKACLTKAKLNLGNSRNIKTEIKTEVLHAIERLYQLVKESESDSGNVDKKDDGLEKERVLEKEPVKEIRKEEKDLIAKMEEHANLIRENSDRMKKLQEKMDEHQERTERQSYASVVAAQPGRQLPERAALYSVIVTSKDETEKGDVVLGRIRDTIKAKEGGIEIENIRKAKDRKVIVGCKTEEERQKVKERLRGAEKYLIVEEIKNKNPLVILKNVFTFNSDQDIIDSIWQQNSKILKDLGKTENKIEIVYKKKTRNPQTHHVVMRVSPAVWQCLVHAGTVVIDLQRVQVADQSPLVQCSLCLGYGHGRRFCVETTVKCSHCGGPHMRTECADWLAGATPSCCNCLHAKADKADHSAFSPECAIRRKWDALARATIAYHC